MNIEYLVNESILFSYINNIVRKYLVAGDNTIITSILTIVLFAVFVYLIGISVFYILVKLKQRSSFIEALLRYMFATPHDSDKFAPGTNSGIVATNHGSIAFQGRRRTY